MKQYVWFGVWRVALLFSFESWAFAQSSPDPTQGGIIVLGPRGSGTHQLVAPTNNGEASRSIMLNVGLGLQAGVAPKGNDRTRFRLNQEIAFFPVENFFIGVALAEGWGTVPVVDFGTGLTYDFDLFIFNLGAKLGYDVSLFESSALALSLVPSVVVGGVLVDQSFNNGSVQVSQSSWYLNLVPSVEVRLLFGANFGIFLRPLQLDLIFPGTGTNPNVILLRDTLVSMDILIGATVQF